MPDAVETYSPVIDIPAIRRNWPEPQIMPPVLAEIGALLRPLEWGLLGYTRMFGSRFNDFWIDHGADLWPQFGMFMRLPEGTEIAIWYHVGATPGGEPVVEIGSEGALNVLAPNLKAFLSDWAAGRGALDLAFLDDDADADPPRTALQLEQRQTAITQMRALIAAIPGHAPSAPVPDLKVVIDAHGVAARAQMAADPVHQAIAQVMDKHIPRGKEPWETYNLQVVMVGHRVELLTNFVAPRYKQRAPLAEGNALIPLLRQARDQRVLGIHAPRGLWHAASLRISPDGLVQVCGDWDSEPKFTSGGPVSRADLSLDLARFPRGPGWHQPWMTQLR